MVKGWEPLGNTSAQPAQTEDGGEGDEDGDQSRDEEPAEGHHAGQVGQSNQLPPHLLRVIKNLTKNYLWILIFGVHHFGLALAREEGSKVHGKGVDPVQRGELAPPPAYNLKQNIKTKLMLHQTWIRSVANIISPN